jgi:uroporphyrinogen-III synthase
VRLLVTRPEPDGERTAQNLRARGHHVLLAPLMRMEAIDFALADEAYGAVVMTSANAARAVVAHSARAKLMARPAFTVGRHTADAARAAGFGDVTSADGDKRDLVRLLGERLPRDRRAVLYLAGEDRSGELAVPGVTVHTAVAYRTVAAERFPPAIATALAQGGIDGVLHFSRRSARAYVDCAARDDVFERALAVRHYCLSRQVSEPLAAASAAGISVAARPNEAALIEMVGDFS